MSEQAASTIRPAASEKPQTFRAPAAKWWQAIACCLLMSLVGLRLYPILLLLIVFFVWRWRTDRYALIVELMLFIGGFGLMPADVLPVKAADFGLIVGIIGFLIYRKNRTVRNVTLAMLAYFAVLFLIASTSLESMSIQFVRLRRYLNIVVFFVPLLVFANRQFSWHKFMDSLVVHALVICGFYVVDAFVLGGYVLLPGCLGGGMQSSIYELYFGRQMLVPRHYPPGLYWLVPCVVALNYGRLRFSRWQWAVILLALYVSRTNSLLFALIICWVMFRPKVKQMLAYGLVGAVVLFAGYHIDKATGGNLRLAANIDQFVSLEAAQDNEDLAEFGTGRMAQILPKWELLSDMKRMHLGFGFIHPALTTNPVFQLRNEYYTDVTQADEVATEVEVTQVQTIFDCGYLGLLAQLAFFIGVYFMIRRLEHSLYYLCTITGAFLLGFGGFAGFNGLHGLTLIGTILGAILCANKPLNRAAPKPQSTEEHDSEDNTLLLAE